MKQRYLRDVVSLALAPGRCVGCGRCVEVCPRAVLALADRRAAIIDRDACIECGACARNCAVKAVTVKAGVGCAAAYIKGAWRGTPPDCGCGDGDCC